MACGFIAKISGDALVIFYGFLLLAIQLSRGSMGAHKKQRIFSILAILTMAVILTCIFTACGETEAQDVSYMVTIHPCDGELDIVWDAKGEIPHITREGYHIAGFYLDESFTISTTLESLKAIGLTKDLDVYIKWEKDVCVHIEVTDAAVAPTCTTTGLTEGKHCSVCKEILQAQTVIPALGHDLVSHEAKHPTCTEPGWIPYKTCTRCDYTTYVEIKKKDHTESDWITDNAATCTKEGTKHIECTECHTVLQTGTIPKTEHTESDWITDVEPTCTKDGTKHIECTECHITLQTGTIAATGHTESDWITDVEPTCTKEGTKHTECTNCHTVFKTSTIPATGHSYSDWIIDVASTCEKAGSMHKECDRCGATENAAIKALGHNLEHHNAKGATCTEIGWEAYDKCTRCDYSTYKEIAAEGHKESDWIIDANATCTENGSKHTICTVCNTIIHTQVLPATGHSYSDAWTHDETYHWHDATCGHDVTSDKVKHIYDEEWNCTVCGYHDDSLHGTEIKAKTLTLDVEHGTLGGKVSNNTKTFSFINEIAIANGSKYTVSTDINGNNAIPTKTVSLEEGDNTFYILVTNGEDLALYTVTLRRRLIYTVTFDVTGGEKVQAQQVEEDSFATEPTTERVGYTFDKWDWDFDNAITDNTTVTASWNIIIYNIVYDLNIPNDSVSQDVDNSMNVTKYTVEDTIVFAAPIRKGYTFAGWTFEKISKGTIDTVTTTANWTVINYDIVYDFGDATSVSKATNNEANPATYTIEDDVIFMVPTRAGYEFVSWDKNIAKGTIDVQTIVASWEIQTYTITYVLNGWTNASDNKATYTVEDKAFALLDGISGESLFCGWYLDKKYTNFIEKIDTSAVKDFVVYAMPDCGATKGLTIQNGVVKSYSGTSTAVVIPSYYKGKSVVSVGSSAFNVCTKLTSVTIPDSVTSIGSSAFKSCTGLTSVMISNNVTSIGDEAFRYCYKLVEVYNKSSLKITAGSSNNGYVAYYAKNVYTKERESKLSTDENAYVIYTDGAEKILVAYIGNKTELILPSDITKIYQYAFSGCAGLTSITIPDSVTSIGNYAFSGCSSLRSITIPFVGAKAGVTSSDTYQYPFGYIFGTSSYTGGVATKQLYYGSSTSSTTSTTYYIPSSLKSVMVTGGNILYGAFYNCNGLTSVTIGSGVTSIGDRAFYDCTWLTSVTIGGGVTSIGDYAFSGCTWLTNIYYTGDVAGWCGISGVDNLLGYGLRKKTLYFDGNKVEGELIIPGSVMSIPSCAFYNCSGLTNVIIPDSVTSIGASAIRGCSGLTSVTIGNGVTSIGDKAFYNCTGLTSVIYKGTKEQWNAISKGPLWKDYVPSSCKVYCTDGTISI